MRIRVQPNPIISEGYDRIDIDNYCVGAELSDDNTSIIVFKNGYTSPIGVYRNTEEARRVFEDMVRAEIAQLQGKEFIYEMPIHLKKEK